MSWLRIRTTKMVLGCMRIYTGLRGTCGMPVIGIAALTSRSAGHLWKLNGMTLRLQFYNGR